MIYFIFQFNVDCGRIRESRLATPEWALRACIIAQKRAGELSKAITWLLWLTPGQKIGTSCEERGRKSPASGELRDASWECVRVSVLALVSDYGQQTFSAMLVYFAPPRRPDCECVRHLRLASFSLYLSGICVRMCACVSVSICISVALAHVLGTGCPKSSLPCGPSDCANWRGDPRRTPFSLWQKLTKINFSANNRMLVCVDLHTNVLCVCGSEIKMQPRQTLWLVEL